MGSSAYFWSFIPIMQNNLHVEPLVYLHTARVHYSNLLEAESMAGYYCSVPFRQI